MALTVGSLFSGIGGLELGFERAGFEIRWQVEIDEWCRRVLTKHWPDVPKYEDVRNVGSHNLEWVDVIVGGFPCQDISNAGKRAGITGERSGLWSEYARIVRALRPRYVVVENVAALLHRGLDVVLGDLAACGYDAEWQCLPAAAFGAPHRRDRLFLVAYPQCGLMERQRGFGALGNTSAECEGGEEEREWFRHTVGRSSEAMAYPPCRSPAHQPELADREALVSTELGASGGALRGRPPQRILVDRRTASCGEADVAHTDFGGCPYRSAKSAYLDVGPFHEAFRGRWEIEPPVGRVANGIPRRMDRLRGLGNAVVPQVAEYVAECVRLHAEQTLWR